MAKAKQTSTVTRIERATKKRPGVHSKCKSSKLKSSKNYKKRYAGQGK
jgi:hypothetical protein